MKIEHVAMYVNDLETFLKPISGRSQTADTTIKRQISAPIFCLLGTGQGWNS